ncbi:hypothetical protein [Kitasatospora sp. NPDC004272]
MLPRPVAELAPLLAWLRTGTGTDRRIDFPAGAATPTRHLLGKGVAATVRHRLGALSAAVSPPVPAPDVAAVLSVHRTAAAPER